MTNTSGHHLGSLVVCVLFAHTPLHAGIAHTPTAPSSVGKITQDSLRGALGSPRTMRLVHVPPELSRITYSDGSYGRGTEIVEVIPALQESVRLSAEIDHQARLEPLLRALNSVGFESDLFTDTDLAASPDSDHAYHAVKERLATAAQHALQLAEQLSDRDAVAKLEAIEQELDAHLGSLLNLKMDPIMVGQLNTARLAPGAVELKPADARRDSIRNKVRMLTRQIDTAMNTSPRVGLNGMNNLFEDYGREAQQRERAAALTIALERATVSQRARIHALITNLRFPPQTLDSVAQIASELRTIISHQAIYSPSEELDSAKFALERALGIHSQMRTDVFVQAMPNLTHGRWHPYQALQQQLLPEGVDSDEALRTRDLIGVLLSVAADKKKLAALTDIRGNATMYTQLRLHHLVAGGLVQFLATNPPAILTAATAGILSHAVLSAKAATFNYIPIMVLRWLEKILPQATTTTRIQILDAGSRIAKATDSAKAWNPGVPVVAKKATTRVSAYKKNRRRRS